MTIPERTLKKWRQDALIATQIGKEHITSAHNDLCSRIIRMTQELLDQNLLRNVNLYSIGERLSDSKEEPKP